LDVAIVADRNLANIFRLAGAESITVETDESAINQVKNLIDERRCKIIIVTETFDSKLKEIREELLKERRSYPIFMVIPGLTGPTGTRRTELQEAVNKSIGVKLKTGL
jgi:vacuolar-type H+-ATPase subunit F/Vma7